MRETCPNSKLFRAPPLNRVHRNCITKVYLSGGLRRETFRIFHGSTNSTRPARKQRTADISALSNVLRVDPVTQTALLEPNVPMDKLVRATLPHGLIPPVVMEFPGITVGGGYAGSAGESSSFRYGYFDQTVNWVEIVLANGNVVRASATENPDLFKGAAGALGTLGITTLIELRLIKAKRYVKTTYHRTSSIREAVEKIRLETEDPANDYVDGILFSETFGVIITGQLTDDKPESEGVLSFSRPWDPWYYLHVKEKMHPTSPSTAAQAKPVVEYLPILEYLFRYDRGAFWIGVEAFKYFGLVPFNRLTRWFLNDFMHTRMLYRALHGSGVSSSVIVQDLSLPYSTAEEFISYSARELGVWPLWLCPLREMSPPSFHPCTTLPHNHSHSKDAQSGSTSRPQPMLNIGLWGRGAKRVAAFIQQNRDIENALARLGGRKVLYSHTYYTEEEFWNLYGWMWYEGLRQRYDATTLPTVYDKVNVDVDTLLAREGTLSWSQWLVSLWPFAGIAGIRSAISSKDYLIHRPGYWQQRLPMVSSVEDSKTPPTTHRS
ncbi:FAD-binding domain-containing protein [Diplogelasinospora grovesii]|uniref:Delta(24)-sterol reductase n=1 Tax=Diplogelasinospora grovesii TaxID=303347 RepID=A0AAN6MV71_9PEZI|nr:FAD-binding domain-containing protein [Diplogelasinospora grovesii]